MAKITPFERLFLDCEIPSLFTQRPFEEMTAPGYPVPHAAFKGRDPAGTRFIFCRRPLAVVYGDGVRREGSYPVVIFQRRHNPNVGVYLVLPGTDSDKYVTQTCEDVREHLPDLTNALVGESIALSTTGALVYINPREGVEYEFETALVA